MDKLAEDVACLKLDKEKLDTRVKEEKLPDIPDLVVTTVTPADEERDGDTPKVVVERLAELRERRKQIEQHWKKEGRTRAYIPNTEQARRMKLQAKLQNRQETKHADIVKAYIEKNTKAIEIDMAIHQIAQVVAID